MKVVFSALARRDLIAIGDYIAADSQSRARSFVLELREACLRLGENPLRFGALKGFESLGLRRRPFGNYLLIYAVSPESVTIVRVFHAAQDIAALLGDDRAP